MKKFIILSTYCFEKASTNGYCARTLAEELRKQGNQVALVGYGKKTTVIEESDVDGDFVIQHNPEEYAVNPSNFEKVKNIIKSLYRPAYDEKLAGKYSEFVCELTKKHSYDAIISFYFPNVCMIAAAKAKKMFPHLKILNYELDSVTDGIKYEGKLAGLQTKANVRWLKKIYKRYDGVIIMKSHEEHVRSVYSDVLGDRLTVTDLPVLQDKIIKKDLNDDEISFIYAGLLDKRYRSPEVLFNLFSENTRKENWKLHFYSKGNCEKDIEEAVNKDKRIFQHGYVSTEELDKSIENAHILISIGNSQSKSVPSKLITYMSYGKPILHFSLQENDVCEEYLKKYPLALIIKNKENLNEVSSKISEFIDYIQNNKISFENLRDAFPMNLPEYSAKLIMESCK